MAISDIILRIVLLVSGAFIVFTGVDFAFGGIKSLGLEHAPLSFTVDDIGAFRERDSHTRFLGGVWLSVGLIFLASAVRFQALREALLACITFIFIGGLARMTAMQPDVLFAPPIVISFALEMIGMPLLFYWVWTARRA